MIFKVICGKEIHVMGLKSEDSLKSLNHFITKVFKNVPMHYALVYVDEDGDSIALASESDFEILLGCSLKTVKIMIEEVSPPSEEPEKTAVPTITKEVLA